MITSSRHIIPAITLTALIGLIGAAAIRPGHSAGGPIPVQVANSSSLPGEVQDVDNPALQPIQFLAQPDTASSGQSVAATNITVPTHKRLVIEYVSAAIGTGLGSVTVETTVGGNLCAYYFIENTSSHNHVFLPTRIYADPGTNVQVSVQSDNGQRAYADVELSGHYVNLP